MKTSIVSALLALSLLTATAGARAAADSSAGIDRETARQVEQALNARGYTAGPADGAWDEATGQALVQFQRAQGLQPTGRADPRTLAMLGIEAVPASN